jgi:hypothetical protein
VCISGYAFACGHAQKYSPQGMEAYGRTCYTGDKIKVKLDCDKQTIEFFINDASQGVAFTNVPVPVRPAISMYGSNTAKLTF